MRETELVNAICLCDAIAARSGTFSRLTLRAALLSAGDPPGRILGKLAPTGDMSRALRFPWKTRGAPPNHTQSQHEQRSMLHGLNDRIKATLVALCIMDNTRAYLVGNDVAIHGADRICMTSFVRRISCRSVASTMELR